MMPSCAPLAIGESVYTFMSGETGNMHDTINCGPRPVSTSTMHCRHMPTDVIREW